MKAQDLMSQPAITCDVNDSLARAAQLMWDHDCGLVVIVREDGKLAGVITDRDICMAAYTQGRPLAEILVNSAMAVDVITATPSLDIAAVEKLMADQRVRRLPVVDADRRPIGMVSINDLALHGALPTALMAAICEHRPARAYAA